jgi:hypothetical protein
VLVGGRVRVYGLSNECRVGDPRAFLADNMDANISVAGRVSKVRDLSMHDLLALIDEATELVSGAS